MLREFGNDQDQEEPNGTWRFEETEVLFMPAGSVEYSPVI
jgi:hypothetical protein